MTEHLPECPLGLPCQSGEPEHVRQETIAGIPVTICGLCMTDCICEQLRTARDRGYSEACDDGWGEPEHIKEALSMAVQRVMELPDLSDAGFTYMNLLNRATVIDAIRGES